MDEPSRLARRLNTADAAALGLGAMLGSGVFAALGFAIESAGSGVLVSLLLAAFAAYCNASSSAQLAALYPQSGGTYVYGRKQLNPFWGWIAGWGFIAGKLASCTAAALTFGFYVFPAHAKLLALAAVAVLTAVNYFGIQKTVRMTWVLLVVVLSSLAVAVFALLWGGQADPNRLAAGGRGTYGILQAAGILFFAFAGYARIATLGEEVLKPRRTIPKAIAIALITVLTLYLIVTMSLLLTINPASLAHAHAPLLQAVEAGRFAFVSPIVKIGAVFAALGVLLSLILGISRTVFAMAAEKDLSVWFAAVHPRFKTPYRAEIAAGLLTGLLIFLGDIREVIGFSAFTVLSYYAITNASAWTLPAQKRQHPRRLAAAGFMACALLALSLPLSSVLSGSLVLGLGAAFYFIRRRPRM